MVIAFHRRLRSRRARLPSPVGMPADARQLARDGFGRQDRIHASGGDRASRPSYFALLLSWAKAMPAASMAFIPEVPSEAVPVRITPTALKRAVVSISVEWKLAWFHSPVPALILKWE